MTILLGILALCGVAFGLYVLLQAIIPKPPEPPDLGTSSKRKEILEQNIAIQAESMDEAWSKLLGLTEGILSDYADRDLVLISSGESQSWDNVYLDRLDLFKALIPMGGGALGAQLSFKQSDDITPLGGGRWRLKYTFALKVYRLTDEQAYFAHYNYRERTGFVGNDLLVSYEELLRGDLIKPASMAYKLNKMPPQSRVPPEYMVAYIRDGIVYVYPQSWGGSPVVELQKLPDGCNYFVTRTKRYPIDGSYADMRAHNHISRCAIVRDGRSLSASLSVTFHIVTDEPEQYQKDWDANTKEGDVFAGFTGEEAPQVASANVDDF